MFFTLLCQFSAIGFFTLIYNLIHIFDPLIFGFSYQLDVVSRFNLSDSLINFFNFYWTSNLYLTLVFFIIYLFLMLYFPLLTVTQLGFILMGLLGWFLENSNFLLTNQIYSHTLLSSSEVNTLLTNNLNKYHPLILYMGAFSTPMLLLFTTCSNYKTYQFLENKSFKTFVTYVFFFWKTVILDLIFMGF